MRGGCSKWYKTRRYSACKISSTNRLVLSKHLRFPLNIRNMSAGETVTVVTPALGRIQCAPGYATQSLYVTIVDGEDHPRAKTALPANQHFCMVRTSSMGQSFMLVEYPHLNKVLKANTSNTAVTVEAVGGQGEYLVHGGKLPRDFGKEYQYSLQQTGTESSKYSIRCEIDCRRILQTGGSLHGTNGKENAQILVDWMEGMEWEYFSFENPPAAA